MQDFFILFVWVLSGQYFETSLKYIYFLKGIFIVDIFPMLGIKTKVSMNKKYRTNF